MQVAAVGLVGGVGWLLLHKRLMVGVEGSEFGVEIWSEILVKFGGDVLG